MPSIDSVGGNNNATPSNLKEAIPTIGASVPQELAEKVGNTLKNVSESTFSAQELQLVHADRALQKAIFAHAKTALSKDNSYVELKNFNFDLVSTETFALFWETCRDEILQAIVRNVYVPINPRLVRQLAVRGDPADVQHALSSGIAACLFDSPMRVPGLWCLELVTPEMLDTIRNTCRSQIKDVLIRRIQSGQTLTSEYFTLASPEMLADVQEDATEMRAMLSHRMRLFFGGFEGRQFADRVGEVLDSLDAATLHRALYDKTLPPVGLKFHTSDKDLVRFIMNTRGFVAHNQNTCFVAPHPAMNDTFLGLCMSVLNGIGGRFPTPDDPQAPFAHGYVQVCTPERLSNKGCGLASIAYALAHSQQNIDDSMLATNQLPDNRLAIYDKGGIVSRMYIPTRDGKSHAYDGRTDFVLARTWEDIRYARLAASLVASSEHPELLFHDLGVSFTRDLEALLVKHGVSHWLDSVFVVDYQKGPRPLPVENTRYAVMLRELSALKADDAEVIRRHSIDTGTVADVDKYLASPEEKNVELDGLLTEEVRALLEKYERALYAHGYINELTKL